VMYVGLDVHKKMCYGTVMDEGGRVVRQGKFGNDFEALYGFMDGLEGASVVMESGYCWQPLYEALEESGHNVKLAHPKEVKALAKKKTDKVDSETLAHLLRTGLLPESYVPPPEIRELRDRVRRRAFLVGMRTKVRNRIRAELVKRRIRLGISPWTRKGGARAPESGLGSCGPGPPHIGGSGWAGSQDESRS